MCYNNYSSNNTNRNNNSNNINNSKQIMSNNSIKDNFRTPLTPLHRGGRERLHKGGIKGIHSRGLEVLAFSLIELSIVLIIIGLLVAGVTGGKSLIDSARSRALINELREYERAVWTFRAARDRWPGDVRNRGIFGYWAYSSTDYKETDFPSDFVTEFRKTAGSSTALPNDIVAPFAELYIDGIIDFKPLGNSNTADRKSTTKGVPNSKAIEPNNMKIKYNYLTSSIYGGTPCSGCSLFNGLMNFGNTKTALDYSFHNYSSTKGINPKFLKKIDEKIDDGEYWNGKMRTACYGSNSGNINNSYDNAIKNGKVCTGFYYAM